jgi:hypothetical protein
MHRWLLVGLGCLVNAGCGAVAGDSASGENASRDDVAGEEGAGAQGVRGQALGAAGGPVGVSLLFNNGVASTRTLYGIERRYMQELDIVESVPAAADDGLATLIASSRVAALDWAGVAQVEEIWVPSLDGTFTRERYYRNARWMEQPSVFTVEALGPGGAVLGSPWVVRAGRDDAQSLTDDTFVRRFDARQLALGCPAVGNCTGATYLEEALVQVRDALHPILDARVVPPLTASLRLTWNRLPGASYQVDVEREPQSAATFDPGFQVKVRPASAPANGHYFVPGEAVSFQVSFLDGNGHRLHPSGQLPTYAEYASGQVESGLRYLDLTLQTRLYYSLKHRESNMLFVLSGPTNALRTPQTVVDPTLFFGPQVPFATTAVDGFTAVAQTIPPTSIIFGGLADPTLWSLPVSDIITFTIPADAQPGTYVAALKARRDYGGEALNRGTTVDIQVGQTAPSSYTAATTCSTCHSQPQKDFGTLLHGLDDRRACFGCHASLGIELDNALDIRVHTIHDRSDRFDADIHDCGLCHITPPTGPQRGVLP